MPNTTPAMNKMAFDCPNCNAYAQQRWQQLLVKESMRTAGGHVQQVDAPTEYKRAKCEVCGNHSLWLSETAVHGRLIYPPKVNAQLAHPDMPASVAEDFNEARLIVGNSPRGAAALLRLAIQKLMPHLGAPGDNINADIKFLVQQGLPVLIQQALDIVRVTGNNAVHPGEIVFDDTSDTASTLFEIINLIVENRISEPARISQLFNNLPSSALDAIKKRDAPP